jgi:OmcA/MtrC family decaheme c-type cytochrome
MRSATIVQWLALIVMGSLFFLGCDGKEGAQGPPGEQGPEGPQGEQGPPGESEEPTVALEACMGCHGPGAEVPVGDINDPADPHFVDTDPDGPLTPSGYRKLDVDMQQATLGASVVMEFHVSAIDANGNTVDVDNLLASDGRFTIAHLIPGTGGDPDDWQSLINRIEDPDGVGDGPGTPEMQATAENFTTNGGMFENLGGGDYRYTSAYDPTGDFANGDTMRIAIQLSAGDIPAGNGWCDFDAPSTVTCDDASLSRAIVQTATCNGCHGATSDVKLALHGGGRTDVEYCVTCHNPGTVDANSGNSVYMTVLVHKIHAGSSLTVPYKIWGFRNSLHDYSNVNFTRELDDCLSCHRLGDPDPNDPTTLDPADPTNNWATRASIEACTTCHDDLTGANHVGGDLNNNASCSFCHPADDPRGWTPGQPPAPVRIVHRGEARAAEAARYAGPGNGYVIQQLDLSGSTLTIQFSVVRDGIPMDLDNDREWNSGGASRLAISVGWTTADYTNEGSGSAPANPISINALDDSGIVTDLGGGLYETSVSLPSSASDTITVSMDGHPAADLVGHNTWNDRIAVKNTAVDFDVEGGRSVVMARRQVVEVDKCNGCHDSAGQGISLHGNNRTGTIQVCTICHNPNNTDVNRRPADPTMAADGKAEESIDFKRLIHQIHSGAELENGIVVYGFGGSVHDFSHVEFIGNRMNCLTCHVDGNGESSYGAEQAHAALPSTIDTGEDKEDPGDDLNISSTAAVCSACHDDDVAKGHMIKFGASFMALDRDIH